MPSRTPSDAQVLRSILGTVSLTFVTYLCIGMSLSVLPGFVHNTLGFGAMLAGLAISMQYLATLLSRPQAGRMADARGPKRTVMTGLSMAALSGGLLLLSALLTGQPWLSFSLILLARLALGCAESCVGTGAIAWGMGQVGHQHTARVISWNGVATYGGVAAGAPLGVLLTSHFGFGTIGIVSLLLMLLTLPVARRKPATSVSTAQPSRLRTVASRILPYGLGLALGSVGFGCIATFITLYYASHGWQGAAFALSLFGIAFISIRFIFGRSITRFGGYRVAIISLLIETGGLILLANADSILLAALGATITGIGFSLVFPALGVEAVHQVPAHSRGSAIGLYSVSMDVAMAITGPLGGWIAGRQGYATVYASAAGAAVLAIVLTILLQRQATRPFG